MEQNYEFRRRHFTLHQPGRRSAARQRRSDEVEICSNWSIGGDGGCVLDNALRDFQEYLWVSMGTSVKRAGEQGEETIWFKVDETLEKGFVIEAGDQVLVRLATDREAFRAVVYLEDVMNLEGGPFLPRGETVRRPLYDNRCVHSGSSLDEFPDEELLAMVHAGYDSIVIFVKDFDQTTKGYCDINDVIIRAKKYGISVMLYNYMKTYIHPDDAKAPAVFDATYGELFRRYPDAAGLMMCGESLEFPSKDPHTTGKLYSESVQDGIPDTRPSPGWYPCEDYPAYLAAIVKAVHAVKPEAEVIFSTYNWCYESGELREGFLARYPEGLSLKVCYEIQAKRSLEGLKTPVMDYTISQDAPGEYFTSECAFAKKYGIPVWGNVNTAGIAWDFGCVPYVPAPYKLLNRLRYLRQAREEYGVTSHYATHHYGWWNCVCADLGKWASWEDFEPDYEELLRKIAVRDYGEQAAPYVLRAWKYWSEAMDYYVASNEDQYGPWRVGAAYPFIFQPNITRTMLNKEIKFPTAPHAHFGHAIVKTLYAPYECTGQAPAFLRYPAELRSLKKMETLWAGGLRELWNLFSEADREKATQAETVTQTGSLREENAEYLAALGQFILCELRTVMHIKHWWKVNMKVQLSEMTAEAFSLLDEMVEILREERENVLDAIPAAECDSRLGWEPSMEYVCDRWHLDWKLRQMESALREIEAYRGLIEEAYRKK